MTVEHAGTALDKTRVRADLDRDGYVLVTDLGGQRFAISLLQELGWFIPQYKGALEHEVVHRPGFEGMSYSQSVSTILAHTEAPGWNPSPHYLALYCHRQARCGGGHTELFDGWRLVELLDTGDIRLLTDRLVTFPGPDGDVRSPMLAGHAGKMIFRFSYNLLTFGDYDPKLDSKPELDTLPLGREGAELAEKVSTLFGEHRTSVLIPDDALLVWDNQRMLHARSEYADKERHLVRYWMAS